MITHNFEGFKGFVSYSHQAYAEMEAFAVGLQPITNMPKLQPNEGEEDAPTLFHF